MKLLVLMSALFSTLAAFAEAIPVAVKIDARRVGAPVSPLLHGIFFEDINYAADGGLYAELVQNRSFEHADSLIAWGMVSRNAIGTVEIRSQHPLNSNNSQYAHLRITDAAKGFGIANYGYAGIPLRASEKYFVSLYARATGSIPLRIELEDESGRIVASHELTITSPTWKKFEATLVSGQSVAGARLAITAFARGELDLDVISLFPEQTFKSRTNGLRNDIAQTIASLKPAFIRFPGGCIVEGQNLDNRYQWKHTIGDIAERKQNWNRWQDAIRDRKAPNYHQTYGLGFFEYFQFAEDIGAKPIPILNVGMACQYQSKELVPLTELDPYIQDALDLIEFANGPADSTWGGKRAAMGHPAPFNLEYLGIGNEQWGEDYFARYNQFDRAIRKKYPKIKLVSGSGPGVDDKSWQLAWNQFRSGTRAAMVDEHYYRPPQWFLENATRYDPQFRQCSVSEARKCPRVFAGEFAAHDSRDRRPSLRAAIAEAAFMTGLQRNSDLVTMSSYAPLLARADAFQWAPNLIWFDDSHVLRTPSYYVQQLFSQHRPENAVALEIDGAPVNMPRLPAASVATFGAEQLPPFSPQEIPTLYAFAGVDKSTNSLVVFAVNPFDQPRAMHLTVEGLAIDAKASLIRISGATPDAINSFAAPDAVVPVELDARFEGNEFRAELPPHSLTILRATLENGRH